jgi:alpha-tubulin suppressor-like RCC1 family protein
MMPMIAAAVVACSAGDTHVSCSPTLTCTLNDARFKPAPMPDAGPLPCDPKLRRCRATRITAGGAHSCAIAQAGELYCWGRDTEGQLGLADAEQDAGSTTSAPVLEMAKKVSAGGAHTCAIADDGSVFCFGRDVEGQVSGGAGEPVVQSPRRVAIEPAMDIGAGDAHSCAVTENGVVCWGSARYGQVGRAVMDGALGPGLVPGTEGAVEVAAGVRHSCARLKSGHVLCWGELIDAETGDALATADATQVPGLKDATAITAGAGHSCALRADGDVVCWGANDSGQLGDGTTNPSATPVLVQGLAKALHVAAGGGLRDGALVGHSCAVDKGFFVQCWGRNTEGQLGTGTATDSPRAVSVLGLPDEADAPYLDSIVAIDAGGFHTCALSDSGRALCWGDDSAGQLGKLNGRSASFGRATRVGRFSRFQ